MSRYKFDCRDNSLLPFAWINVATEQRNVMIIIFQELLKQCRDIKIHYRDINLSSDLHYVATYIFFVATFII